MNEVSRSARLAAFLLPTLGLAACGDPPALASEPAPPVPLASEASRSLLTAAWIAEQQRNASEPYWVREVGGELVARARGLDVRFDDRGAHLTQGGEALGALSLARFGCASELERGARSAPAFERNRVRYARGSGVEEWYLTGPVGLEQGFTVRQAPDCARPGAELVIEVEADGLTAEGDGDTLTLTDGRGERLRYAHLTAKDADGRVLPARMSAAAEPGVISLAVDVAGATWPVEIDPLVTGQEAMFWPSEGAAEDHLGRAVAIDGDTAIIGVDGADASSSADQGAALVFVWEVVVPLGTWVFEGTLTASDGAGGDRFGCSVAVSGDTALVGACADDVGASTDQGSAYVFVRAGGVWTQEAKLTASDGATGDAFGGSLALSGDTALVGVAAADVGGSADQGAAYVFGRAAGVWSEEAKLTSSDGEALDEFGASVALDGDSALVGARGDDGQRGSAYAFVRLGGIWTEQAKLTASDGVAGDALGSTVALSGDTALGGAPAADVGPNVDQGAAYAFVRAGGVWAQEAKITASDGAAFDGFARSVSLDGDLAVAGADGADVAGNADAGRAYILSRSGGVWTEQAEREAKDGRAGFLFGGAVAISGSHARPPPLEPLPARVLVGAPGADGVATPDEGATYVFTLDVDWFASAPLTTPFRHLGWGAAVALSGDTALVGAPSSSVGGVGGGPGAVWVFGRTAGVWNQQVKLVPSDGLLNDGFGRSVALSGDTALVGAPGHGYGSGTWGAAYVFVRSGGIWTEQAKLTASDGGQFGWSVALSGDTAVVGAPSSDIGSNDAQGAAFVFVRSGGLWTQEAKLSASDGGWADIFGSSVALEQDTAVFGAAERAHVFVREQGTWIEKQELGPTEGIASVALSGDLALVGSAADLLGGSDSKGSVFVFSRSQGVWAQEAKLLADDVQPEDHFGQRVALSGGVALIGVPLHDDASSYSQGAAYAFVPSATGVWEQQAKLVAPPDPAICKPWACDTPQGDEFGASVALFGTTALVGAPADETGGPNRGAVYAFTLYKELGDPCLLSSECGSAFCVDGVCCDTPCDGPPSDCRACSVAAGAATDGTCGPTNGAACDDGDACTAPGLCVDDGLGSSTCVAGATIDCDDLNVCTVDGCDPEMGCTHAPVANGTDCGAGTCAGGVCGPPEGGGSGGVGGQAEGGGTGGLGGGGGEQPAEPGGCAISPVTTAPVDLRPWLALVFAAGCRRRRFHREPHARRSAPALLVDAPSAAPRAAARRPSPAPPSASPLRGRGTRRSAGPGGRAPRSPANAARPGRS